MRTAAARVRPLVAAVALAGILGGALAGALAGCGGDDEVPDVDPGELLAAAADELAGVQTVRMQISSEGDVAQLPVRGVDAQVTADGDAAGTAQVEMLDQLLEVDLVVVGDEFHYRLLGSWQQGTRADAADVYDPSVILDEQRGLAQLLRTATVAGVSRAAEDGYRVPATFDAEAAGALLPGAPDDLTGTVWIMEDRPLPTRLVLDLPDGSVTVDLTDYDAPADIRAP